MRMHRLMLVALPPCLYTCAWTPASVQVPASHRHMPLCECTHRYLPLCSHPIVRSVNKRSRWHVRHRWKGGRRARRRRRRLRCFANLFQQASLLLCCQLAPFFLLKTQSPRLFLHVPSSLLLITKHHLFKRHCRLFPLYFLEPSQCLSLLLSWSQPEVPHFMSQCSYCSPVVPIVRVSRRCDHHCIVYRLLGVNGIVRRFGSGVRTCPPFLILITSHRAGYPSAIQVLSLQALAGCRGASGSCRAIST